jgi:hypothetical protein
MSDRKTITEIDEYFLQKPGFHTRGIKPIIQYHTRHALYKISLQTLLHLNIVNWKYNRPPDMSRCEEIAKYYISIAPASHLDATFILHLNTDLDQFEVIDGIHRLTALYILQRQFNEDANTQQKHYWFYNTVILVSIRKDYPEMALAQLFYSINKSISVSALHIENIEISTNTIAYVDNDADADADAETTCPIDAPPPSTPETISIPIPIVSIQNVIDRNHCRVKIIEKVAEEWQIKFKHHFSTNPKCRIPNINRDRFIEILDEMMKILEPLYELDVIEDKLNTLLEITNSHAKIVFEHQIDEVPTKIKKSGRYIFWWSKKDIIYWANHCLVQHLNKPVGQTEISI